MAEEDKQYISEVTITADQGVIKKVITAGTKGAKPLKGQQLSVHYEGRLQDGTVFDSSYQRGTPIEVRIGEG